MFAFFGSQLLLTNDFMNTWGLIVCTTVGALGVGVGALVGAAVGSVQEIVTVNCKYPVVRELQELRSRAIAART